MLGIQLYITSAEGLREEIMAVVNDPEGFFRQKPMYGTGLWTSTWRSDTQDSDWVDWCRGEDFGGADTKNWWLLTPQPEYKIYTIDSFEDLNRCLKDYGNPVPLAAKYDLFAKKRVIDFEKLALEFDGLHLTEQGNEETHLSCPNDLNAWDCESTLWFHWCFAAVEKIAVLQPVTIEP